MLLTALYIAICFLIAGLLYQLYSFINGNTGFPEKKQVSTGFSFKDFFLNTIFQRKLFNAGKTRWLIHFLVILGFLYLVIFHALDDMTSFRWFRDYQPTMNPFQFLRNLAGFFVLAGCLGFLYRRLIHFKLLWEKQLLCKGLFSILLILTMVLSGFFLEAVKIISAPVFFEMVEEYSDIDETTGLEDLKLYWEKQYGVVFNEALAITPKKLANGKNLSEENCMDCHSPIKSAFISGTLARGLKKAGAWLNDHRTDKLVYYVHYFLSLLILASLPFSRLLHMFLIPVASLEKNIKKEHMAPNHGKINTATLYGCTNCGFCSDVCSVYPNFLITGNIDSLPHSKIQSFKQHLLSRAANEPEALYRLLSGNAECTMCRKCTDICPSGIDLQNLWCILDQQLVLKGFQDNYPFIDSFSLKKWDALESDDIKHPATGELTTQLVDNAGSFENCVQCTICTNVCPIVEYDVADNDMTPQQIMNLLRLGKQHLATGTRMVWNCLTCFSCQENCPQGIRVADIMLELRNIGSMRSDEIKRETLTDKRTK